LIDWTVARDEAPRECEKCWTSPTAHVRYDGDGRPSFIVACPTCLPWNLDGPSVARPTEAKHCRPTIHGRGRSSPPPVSCDGQIQEWQETASISLADLCAGDDAA